jgi:hypothetical protein
MPQTKDLITNRFLNTEVAKVLSSVLKMSFLEVSRVNLHWRMLQLCRQQTHQLLIIVDFPRMVRLIGPIPRILRRSC